MELIKTQSIKAIDKTTVHRICSGQVVLNLAIAVKEIVENSLDAGATVIDIKLKEYGSEVIEIVDNGVGVEPSNFEGLTLKHHTSKLQDFSDLVSVETFGFRGEALSSLCALSELSIVTRHKSESCGTSLSFDRNGHIIDCRQHARQVGTTVTLFNLFSALPVRQKEFHKNLKREFNKMTQLLSAYCLVSTGVKISCVNQTKNNTRTTFLSTQGCKTVKENISCIFGAKQLSNLLEIKQKLPSNEILDELKVTEEDCRIFALEGFISSCAHGSGRGSNDRQFYFINSRPCEPAKIMKQVNEVYHQFNVHQYPFVFLNIKVSKGSVDVNVTPDKRKFFLTEEKLLLALIKASLLELFEEIPSTFSYNNVALVVNKTPTSNGFNGKPNLSKFDAWRHRSDGKRKNEICLDENVPKKQMKCDAKNLLEQFCLRKTSENLEKKEVEIKENLEICNNKNEVQNNESVTISHNRDLNITINEVQKINSDTLQNVHVDQNKLVLNTCKLNEECDFVCENSNQVGDANNTNAKESVTIAEKSIPVPVQTMLVAEEALPKVIIKDSVPTLEGDMSKAEAISTQNLSSVVEDNLVGKSISIGQPKQPVKDLVPVEFDEFEERGVRSVFVPADLDSIRESLYKRTKKSITSEKITTVNFRTVIDPLKNQQAEKELSKHISKDMFEQMEIIGQFNLGFIITKLNSDLFIIDQHATDEKYNFETLQQTTVISNQKLVLPQFLELTAANECVVIENINVFKKNGFEFQIDETAIPTKRISLTAIPMSKNWVFGKDDIDELIFMLQDSPGANCRPSRVRAMFASRACRKSVMIGTALGEKDMRRLINNMGTIEQPWDCQEENILKVISKLKEEGRGDKDICGRNVGRSVFYLRRSTLKRIMLNYPITCNVKLVFNYYRNFLYKPHTVYCK